MGLGNFGLRLGLEKIICLLRLLKHAVDTLDSLLPVDVNKDVLVSHLTQCTEPSNHLGHTSDSRLLASLGPQLAPAHTQLALHTAPRLFH